MPTPRHPAAATTIEPDPLPTEKLVAGLEFVQAPPTSATPSPLVTVRSKVSAAKTCCACTVMSWLTVPVAPSSSVTVRVTV